MGAARIPRRPRPRRPQPPLDQIGDPEALSAPEPVWAGPVIFDHVGALRVKAFAVARSDVAVYLEIAWQERLQRAGAPRDTVTVRQLAPRARRRSDRWALGPPLSLPELARGGPEVDLHEPGAVLAWLQCPARILEVEARVIAYTDRAALVEWGFGQSADCAWVWRDAIRSGRPSKHQPFGPAAR